jgi:broad specificity phosphatase PhoE
MKKFYIIILLILGIQSNIHSQQSDETFTIYLVRHSEKDLFSDNSIDPPLTKCGEQRSENLSAFLKDVELDAIYSTNYTRTKNTALPTSISKNMVIKQYDAQDLESFSKFLIKKKQNALVVGHSNTTGVLAGLLVGQEIGAFDLNIYNRIYQVVIYKNQGRLHLLNTVFDCTY